jgi:acyl carrier protein
MNTVEQIGQIFRETLQIEVPSPTVDIISAGLLDSLVLVTLLYEIEEHFGVQLPLDALDIEQLRTIETMAALVNELADSGRSHPRVSAVRR